MFSKMFDQLSALPVSGIARKVVKNVLLGTVTIVASATGSGKTLLLPANLARATNDLVVVLVPRRFLAVNAAETVAELSGLTVGQEIGYAIGAQSGEDSQRSANTKILYCTYGYALASGLINTAGVIVFDEVHEASLDMSICRALVQRRIASGQRVHVLEMSATINAERQAAYWRSVASVEVVEIDGRTFPCQSRHRPAQAPEDAVVDLIREGRKGILVFRPGRGEVEETAQTIRDLVGEGVEVAEIYGELDYLTRKEAVAAPKGGVKVLVGTNVVESGANIPWLDSGVTCGTAKELSVRLETGATILKLIDLPRWRLDQQEGRIKRFRDGIFVLCSPLAYKSRPAETTPEIKRLTLTELVMHCAGFKLRAEQLVFDYPPEQGQLYEAETKLQRLGLIDDKCRLTNAGQFVSGLPVGPETGALLWHAKEIGVLGAVLPLAALIEVDGVRKDFRFPHGLNGSSDWLDGYKAFLLAYVEGSGQARKDLMERYNIGFKRFSAVKDMFHDLNRRFEEEVALTLEATDEQLIECLVAGFITNLFQTYGTDLIPVSGSRHVAYNRGNNSVVRPQRGFVLGQLRTIQPKDKTKTSFTVVEKLTDVSLENIMAMVKVRPALVTIDERRVKVGPYQYELVVDRQLFGIYNLPQERVPSPLTAEEQAAMLALEQKRYEYRERLSKQNGPREALDMTSLRFFDDYFRLGYFGQRFSYAEEDVVEAERVSALEVDRRKEEIERERAEERRGLAEMEARRKRETAATLVVQQPNSTGIAARKRQGRDTIRCAPEILHIRYGYTG
jgi:HrpA-like RNA helicase